MNNSRSFDRAAGYYDQTRPYFESLERAGSEVILNITGPAARVLDVGTGTGRISIPLLQRGLDLIGCDLSEKMLRRLQEKFPAARVAQADASRLPFPGASFDVVITAHVLHLAATWREALREFQRVLKPGGTYLNLKTWEAVGTSTRGTLREHWRGWLTSQGIDPRLPGVQSDAELLDELKSLGAMLSEVEVIRYSLHFTLQEQLERFESRIFSDAWEIPQEAFDASIQDLRSWAESEYGDLNQRRADEVRFAIDIARFS